MSPSKYTTLRLCMSILKLYLGIIAIHIYHYNFSQTMRNNLIHENANILLFFFEIDIIGFASFKKHQVKNSGHFE